MAFTFIKSSFTIKKRKFLEETIMEKSRKNILRYLEEKYV